MGFNDEPMIKQKEYSDEEYKSKKKKSFSVAKRALIMQQVSIIAGWNMVVALVLFLVLMLGTSALPYIINVSIDFSSKTFSLRGGMFITVVIVFLIIFTIAMFWYAIGYKRLEIMCIHLYGGLDGAEQVNEAAQRDNLSNNLEKAVGLYPSNYSSLSGPGLLMVNYLDRNGIKSIDTKIFTAIKWLLILGQVIMAALSLYVLII